MKKYIVHYTIGKKRLRSVITAASTEEAASTVRNGLRIQNVEPAHEEAKEDAELARLKRMLKNITDIFK